MSDEFKTQFSVKVGADMHNFRGEGPAEVEAQLDEILRPDSEYISKSVEVAKELRAQAALVEGLGATPVSGGESVQQQQSASGHTCAHGQRQYREGTGRTGKWQAWFCPLEKGDPNQCKPEFVN